MNLFGSPNNMGIGQICWNPRVWMDMATFGWSVEADIVPGLTECLVLWGTNPAQSDNSAFWQHIRAYAAAGAPLSWSIRGEPRLRPSPTCGCPVRPGTDAVLALGLLNVIIGEELYDASFVDAWSLVSMSWRMRWRRLAPEAVAVNLQEFQGRTISAGGAPVFRRSRLGSRVGPRDRPDRRGGGPDPSGAVLPARDHGQCG